jgi:photosystem II stability/assembly factor-like uncharacterized protein
MFMKEKTLVAVLFIVLCNPAFAAPKPVHKPLRTFSSSDAVVPGVVIVKFKQGVDVREGTTFSTSSDAVNQALTQEGVSMLTRAFKYVPQISAAQLAAGDVDVSRIYYATVSAAADPRQIASRINNLDQVEYAEPKFMNFVNDIPNDPLLANQNNMFTRMNAYNGWTIAKGSATVPIAVVDGGTHWQHEDLNPNMRAKQQEDINNNGRFDLGAPPAGDEDGIDQDGNGFVDDVIGWNFANNTNNPRGLSATPNSAAHGTATASHFGARTHNGIGMAGSSWNCSIIGICAASATQDNGIAYGYEGIAYAYANGAKVINCSWGRTGGYSQFEQDLITAATQAGALVVCAAGNGTNNNGIGKNNDASPDYPPSYKNVLAVGATSSSSDSRASFSNYGRTVPVYAPGTSIYSCLNTGGYGNGGDGTSYSSPLVAGLAGIIKTLRPTWTPRQIALQIKTTCDSIDGANPSLAGNLGRGRVNFARALSESHAGIEITNAVLRTPSGRNLFLQNDTIVMTLTVQNILFAAANNLTFTATSSDAAVTVLQGTSSGGNLASGQSITLPAMTFRVGALTAARDVVLRLNWVSNTNDRDSWAYKITVFPSTPSWETQASPTTSILYSVKAVNRSVVWACGGTSPASVVIRTTNGGIAWTDATGNLTGQDLYCIFATDANRAWVGTGSGRIYGTADGGTTWTQQVYPGTQSPFINAIWMFPNGTGYAQGDPSGTTGRFVVLKTTNFGQTWAHTASEPVGISIEAGWNNSLAMTDENRMWFGTNNSRVWRTTDGGATWSSAASGSTNSYAIAFKDVNSGIVGHSTGTVRITVNGGATWTTAATPTASAISGLAYLTGTNLAWAAIGASPYRTSNNATSWSSQTVFPISGTLNHISFVDSTAGWAVTSNGEILRYPTTTTSVHRSEETPGEFSLEQNFPNPFNPTTQIKFNIHNVGTEHVQPVQLKVFDLLGREVATLVNEPLQSGGYTIHFDGSLLSSGVYIYRLRAGSLVQEKRMLLIK